MQRSQNRMHNMRATKPTEGPGSFPWKSEPPRDSSSKKRSRQDEDSQWDRSVRVKESEDFQANWNATNVDNPKADSYPRTEEEKAMDVLLHAQLAASRSLRNFMKDLSDDDEDEEEDDSTVGSDDEGEGLAVSAKEAQNSRKEKAYEYFKNMFQDNLQLWKLYKENRYCGQFECLVCSAEGKKTRKKFPDLAGMIHHSQKIGRTKKVFEHRGYAQAMRQLLGWDSKASSTGCIQTADEKLPASHVKLPVQWWCLHVNYTNM